MCTAGVLASHSQCNIRDHHPFCHEAGEKNAESRLLVRFSYLQFLNSVGWVRGKAASSQKPVPVMAKEWRKKNQSGGQKKEPL